MTPKRLCLFGTSLALALFIHAQANTGLLGAQGKTAIQSPPAAQQSPTSSGAWNGAQVQASPFPAQSGEAQKIPANPAAPSTKPTGSPGTQGSGEGQTEGVSAAPLSSVELLFKASLPAESPQLRQYGYEFFGRTGSLVSAAVGDDYIVGPGDVIVSYFWGDPVDIGEIRSMYELLVDRDGSLFFPPLGRLPVWGQSISSVREIFKATLAKKYKRLETSLTLGRLREFPVYVSGYVEKPGTLVATAVDSVFDAISRAGGVLSSGGLRNLVLTRKDGSSQAIDLYDILVRGRNVDLRLREGDTILVGPIGPVVAVAGEVRRPAIYELKDEKTLAQALELAGGLLPSANAPASYRVRFRDRERRMETVDLSSRSHLGSAVADGDLLYAARVRDAVENAVLLEGALKLPGTYPLDRGNKLSDFLRAAQPLPEANPRYARLERQRADGTRPNLVFDPEAVLSGREDYVLEPRDRITILKNGEGVDEPRFGDFPKAVLLKGAARYPNLSLYREGMRLSSLLSAAQILPETSLFYARLIRFEAGGVRKTIPFIPREILSGTFDLALMPMDEVILYTLDDTSLVSRSRLPPAETASQSQSQAQSQAQARAQPQQQAQTQAASIGAKASPPVGGAGPLAAPNAGPVLMESSIFAEPGDGEIRLLGEARYSGIFAHRTGLMLSHVLTRDQLLPDTNPRYARIERKGMDGKRPNLVFEPQAVLSGETDVRLEPYDLIRLFKNGEGVDKPEFAEYPRAVLVRGALRYPRLQAYSEGLALSSLLRADELLPETSLYYARLLRTETGGLRKIIPFIPREILSGEYDLALAPMDEIVLFTLAETTRTTRFQREVAASSVAVSQKDAKQQGGQAPEGTLGEDAQYGEILFLGEVRYSGIFAHRQGLKLSSILREDQLLPDTNPRYGRIERRSLDGKRPNIVFDPFEVLSGRKDYELEPLDTIRLLKNKEGLDKPEFGEYPSAIVLRGAVRYPNLRSLPSGMRLSEVVVRDQILPETSLYYARIIRSLPGGQKRTLPFIPAEILDGRFDVSLEPMDDIQLFTLLETSRMLSFKSANADAGKPEAKASETPAALKGQAAQAGGAGASPPAAGLPASAATGATGVSLSLSGQVSQLQAGMNLGEVLLLGEVRYSGIFAHRRGLMLSDILKADQLLPETNIYYGQITGVTNEGKKRYLTFAPRDVLSGDADLELEPLDTIVLYKLGYEPDEEAFDSFPDTIVMKGPIRYPGLYAYTPGLRLSSILSEDQLLTGTGLEYGEILRKPEYGRKDERILTFSPQKALAGEYDMALAPMDTVRFYPRRLHEPIGVSGEVKSAKILPYYPGMSLLEVLNTVEFITEAARLKAYIYRSDASRELHYLEDLLTKSGYPIVLLRGGDRVVLQRLLPDERQPFVILRGEVKAPRALPWKPGLSLSDAIAACGGYTGFAFPEAMVIIRKNAAELQRRRVDELASQIDLTLSSLESQGSGQSETVQASVAALKSDLSSQKAQLEALKGNRMAAALGRVAVVVPPSLEALRGSPADIILERDDEIYVPSQPSYVLVVGAVNNQVVLAYRDGMRVREALEGAGWINDFAQLGKAYLIKANGRVHGGRRNGIILFQPTLLKETLGPGDTLVVPLLSKSAAQGIGMARDIVQIVTQMVGTTVSTLALLRSYSQ